MSDMISNDDIMNAKKEFIAEFNKSRSDFLLLIKDNTQLSLQFIETFENMKNSISGMSTLVDHLYKTIDNLNYNYYKSEIDTLKNDIKILENNQDEYWAKKLSKICSAAEQLFDERYKVINRPDKKTNEALISKLKNNIEEWKISYNIITKATCNIVKSNAKKLTRCELVEYLCLDCNKRQECKIVNNRIKTPSGCISLSETQFEQWRKSLPEEYVR